MRTDKTNRMMQAYDGFRGDQTVRAVKDQIPSELFAQLTGHQLGLIMSAVNQAYHNGKAACGCEIIDGDAIYINKLGHLYELTDIAKLQLAIGSRQKSVDKT